MLSKESDEHSFEDKVSGRISASAINLEAALLKNVPHLSSNQERDNKHNEARIRI